CQQGYSYPLSF
nr:immunoglobulin light chain junction region [Macaca mulatta]